MKYVKIEGNIVGIFGKEANHLLDKYGILLDGNYQFIRPQDSIIISLAIVKDPVKAELALTRKGVTALEDETAFNAEIDKYYKAQYKVTSESLYNANLNHLVAQNVINFDEMLPEWTPEQELEYLYSKGVSGIWKKQKPAYK